MQGKITHIERISMNPMFEMKRYELCIEKDHHKKSVTEVVSLNDAPPYNVGDTVFVEFTPIQTRFVNRLSAIGIEVSLGGNLPWIYLDSINDTPVKDTHQARHGFAAFFLNMRKNPLTQPQHSSRFSDRRTVFNRIRRELKRPERPALTA
jgi:hypothetical protein